LWGALLPEGFALSEWLVLAEAAVQSPIGERRILVDVCRFAAASRIAVMSPLPTIRGYPPIHAIIAVSGFVSRRLQGSDLDYQSA
jgi:hypothetical protein